MTVDDHVASTSFMMRAYLQICGSERRLLFGEPCLHSLHVSVGQLDVVDKNRLDREVRNIPRKFSGINCKFSSISTAVVAVRGDIATQKSQ